MLLRVELPFFVENLNMALTNNDILKKLRVAMKFRDDDIIEVLMLVGYKISKSELGAFFRNADHPKYKECQDQILRNFLNGLIIYNRGTIEERKPAEKKTVKDTERRKSDNRKTYDKKYDKKKLGNPQKRSNKFDKEKFEKKLLKEQNDDKKGEQKRRRPRI